jgi:selenoprotein W-related protein
MKPTITIEYCPKCGWLLRAAWMAQELLTTFSDDLHGVTLIPSEVADVIRLHWMKIFCGIENGKDIFRNQKN